MDNEKLVQNWHSSIIKECEARLGRGLKNNEIGFITSRGGFMALEAIEDTIKTLTEHDLEKYLNSETNAQ